MTETTERKPLRRVVLEDGAVEWSDGEPIEEGSPLAEEDCPICGGPCARRPRHSEAE